MSDSIWINIGDGVRLKGYGATTRGPKTTLKIEVEITDTFELAHLLRELGEKSKPKAKPRIAGLLPPPGAFNS
ncbi:hypothetical protein [Paradevosia shaoguanensis]|uniref:Uncharacterized protein n=1 Tax=Paradevosia shaoguanensis TaxID=1335043 RepID=A0AA41QT18_9HYPH|nr:hypothetical protein [Paradevosia shaoguanensis]MCF1744643.1 hypothetical protein [Paradevosia shaoguanensis]MCI0129126.1 hypothetical protein [Paradevosia shaoguanensis]